MLPDCSLAFLTDGSPFSITVLSGLAACVTLYLLTRWPEFLFGIAMFVTVMIPAATR